MSDISKIALAITLALATAACGGGGEPVPFSMVAGELEGNAEAGGFALEGEEIGSPGPTLTVPVGAEVTITLTNQHGAFSDEMLPHDLMVVADKDAAQPDALFEAATGSVLPEASESEELPTNASVTFTPTDAGAYFYICSLPGHVSRGMWGRFVVEET